MATQPVHNVVAQAARPRGLRYRPGDLVTTTNGYPVLYEVLAVDPSGLLRVRGLNWAPGYSAAVSGEDVRPVTSILSHSG
jgi:hypothetical protein